MRRAFLLVALLCTICLKGTDAQEPEHPTPEIVSIVQLLGAPEKFEGHTVMVVGFLRFGFHADILYLHKEDFDNLIDKNGLSISRNPQVVDQMKKLEKSYVQVAGVFTAKHKGELGITSGTIESVRFVIHWPPNR